MPSPNEAVVACAGSGKTTRIVEQALSDDQKKVLIVTYTNENLLQIKEKLLELSGEIPSHISIQSWFTFLFQEGCRPYLNSKLPDRRLRSIYYFKPSDNALMTRLRRTPERQVAHYLTRSGLIYEDKLSKLAFHCNQASGGLVVERLGRIYDHIFIDEAQDLEGWDYDLVGELLGGPADLTLVGDPRQKILKTHRASKNRQFNTVFDWLNANRSDEFDLVEDLSTWRCVQAICDVADQLFPDLPNTTSLNGDGTDHDGVFFIGAGEVQKYFETHQPIVLRHNRREKAAGLPALNIGIAKGRTYKRVLIFPTRPMLEYLRTGDPSVAGDCCKLYVALTRAQQSVTFVVPDDFEPHEAWS